MPHSHSAYYLKQRLRECPQEDYPVHSRIHKLQNFSKLTSRNCFVKREDELGFGISGGKFRKYRTLIPYLLQQGYEEALLIGGAFSNNILSLSQALIENSISPILILKGPRPPNNSGNFLLTQTFIGESSMRWIEQEKWKSISQEAFAYASPYKKTCLLPEGAALFPSFLGSLTLVLDLLENESTHKIEFDHIFFEAGTGFSASALLLGLSFLKRKTSCHIALLADTEEAFLLQLHTLHLEFQQWLGQDVPFPSDFQCIKSSIAPSFGATNKQIFDFIVKTAREEGFLLDPIYSAKLFHTAFQTLQTQQEIQGNILLIHSGGALSLFGFQERIKKSLSIEI